MVDSICDDADPRPRVGISACLLGRAVRYDGGHKCDRFLHDALSQHLQWLPVCPEVEIGLGTPREAIRLVQLEGETRLQGSRSGEDHTDRMASYIEQRMPELHSQRLRGFVLKKDSPSCGMQRVRVYTNATVSRDGRGMFAAALLKAFPNLPIEEEGRLCDARLRENWVERVFAYDDLCQLWNSDWTIGDLIEFHSRYKLTLLAHSQHEYRHLGRLVAQAKDVSRSRLRITYEATFMSALTRISTRRTNTNVLQHMAGFFKRQLDGTSRAELADHIEDYRAGFVSLTVPLTLIRHFVNSLNVRYLAEQTFLNPHPKDLALRNYV